MVSIYISTYACSSKISHVLRTSYDHYHDLLNHYGISESLMTVYHSHNYVRLCSLVANEINMTDATRRTAATYHSGGIEISTVL